MAINGGGKKMGIDGAIVKQKRRENPFLNLGFNIILLPIIRDILEENKKWGRMVRL
jgi:hypothetical protein